MVDLDMLFRNKTMRKIEKPNYQNGENGYIISELLDLSVVCPFLFLGINYQLSASSNNICWSFWLQTFFRVSKNHEPRWIFAHSPEFSFLFSCSHLHNSVFVNSHAFFLFFSLALLLIPSYLCFYFNALLLNKHPTHLHLFTLVNREVLFISFSVLYPFFPSTHVLPCLYMATLSSAVHPCAGIRECKNPACWGLPATHVPHAVSHKDMLNRSTEDVPRDLGPSTGKVVKYKEAFVNLEESTKWILCSRCYSFLLLFEWM